MVRLSRYLITLPVMLLPLVAAGARPGLADAAGVEQAVEILARAKAADSRCHILSEGERDELGRYAARAEIAAASRISVTAARTARSRGDAAGSAADCGATVATDVRDTLAAAREAITAKGRKPQAEISAATAASVASRTAGRRSRPCPLRPPGRGLLCRTALPAPEPRRCRPLLARHRAHAQTGSGEQRHGGGGSGVAPRRAPVPQPGLRRGNLRRGQGRISGDTDPLRRVWGWGSRRAGGPGMAWPARCILGPPRQSLLTVLENTP